MTFAASFQVFLEDADGAGPDSVELLRFVVVASDVLAAKFDWGLENKFEREVKGLDKRVRSANRKGVRLRGRHSQCCGTRDGQGQAAPGDDREQVGRGQAEAEEARTPRQG